MPNYLEYKNTKCCIGENKTPCTSAGCSSPLASCFMQRDSLPINVSIKQHGHSSFCNPAAVSSCWQDSLKPQKNHAVTNQDLDILPEQLFQKHHCEKLTDHLCHDHSLGRVQYCLEIILLLISFFWVLFPLLPMPAQAVASLLKYRL